MIALGAAVDPDEARRVARNILGGRQYHASPAPRPLRKQLSWIGDRVHGVADWFGRVISDIPGWFLLSAAAVVIVLVIVYVAIRASGRRAAPEGRGHAGGAADTEDPRELEQAADEAERAGRLDDALRLRFRAGLLRLGARGAIQYRPSVTTNEVRRVLGSETFDELARTFESVAYGGRDAAAPDLDAARTDWPRVVANASRARADNS